MKGRVLKGARAQIRAASDPSLETVTGRYFVRQHEKPPPRAALDQALAGRLWEESERIAERLATRRAG